MGVGSLVRGRAIAIEHSSDGEGATALHKELVGRRGQQCSVSLGLVCAFFLA